MIAPLLAWALLAVPGHAHSAHRQYVWVDSTGAQATAGPLLEFLDGTVPYLWSLDQKSGDVVFLAFVPVRLFESVDCTGDAWVTDVIEFPAPRVPFTIDSDSGFYVLADTQGPEPLTFESILDNAICIPTGPIFDDTFYKLSTMIYDPLLLPPSNYVGPLHPESPPFH